MRASAVAILSLLVPSIVRAQVGCSTAPIDGHPLRYCTGGTGRATVVFESELGRGAGEWDSAAARVAGFAHVLTYDRAGPGTPSDVAGSLLRLLDHLDIGKPVVLVASGGGSWLARAFAERYPERVAGLVLIDPPHEEFETRARSLLTAAEQAARDSALAAARSALPDAARREGDAILATPASEWSRSLPDVPLIVLILARHDWVPANQSVALERLWREMETALAGRVTDGRVQVAGGSGPDLAIDQPDMVAGSIRDVVNRSTRETEGSSNRSPLALPTLIAMIVLGVPSMVYATFQIWKAMKAPGPEEPDPHRVPLKDLIGKKTAPAGRAVALLRSANAEALHVYQTHMTRAPAVSRAEELWGRTWVPADWQAQRAWVEPFDSGSGRDATLAEQVLGMLAGASPGPDSGRIWILGPAGAGKSTFMTHLFFAALSAPGPLPVPMFVQSRIAGFPQIRRLRDAEDGFSAFIEGWLENRKIQVPAEAKPALIADFGKALGDGSVTLFLDGFDELVDLGLLTFLHDLLERTDCWVCSERSDRRLSRSGTSIMLPGTWSLGQIEQHLAARWPERPEWRTRVLEHFRRDTDGDHVLRVPRYLDLFLDRLEKSDELPDEHELRELSRGGPELAADIVALAMSRLPAGSGDATEHEINARLFRVAAARVEQADFVLPRTERDAVWSRILQMTEFVSHVVTPDGDNIRITHPALVDYFLAGQIATELRSGARALTQGDRHWSRGLLAGVSHWLRRYGHQAIMAEVWRRIESTTGTAPCANLLELAIQLEVDGRQNARRDAPERDLRRQVTIATRSLAGRNLAGADLRLVTFTRCRFDGARLDDADLEHATFHDCEFAGAVLTEAKALGAEFARCRFLAASAPELLPKVEGFQIAAAEFHEGTDAASDVGGDWLTEHGAVRTRTRYGGEFGRLFFSRQKAFLGEVAESLERGAYRQRIEEALARCPMGAPITVVDLMAGGGNEWLAELVAGSADAPARLPGLRVLGIDRDMPQLRELKRKFPAVFKWYQMEIGQKGLDLPAIVGEAFGTPGQRLAADLIVAKKAIHEVRRPLQGLLLAQCFAGLRAEGELVLFADSPGPDAPGQEGVPERDFLEIDRDIRALLLDATVPLARIRDGVTALRFDGTPAGQARFCNLWVLLKDWANDNLHEVRNRWFSSAAEIRTWAREAGFVETAPPAAGRYRLAVARFNERGIQSVVHHLERNGAAAVRNDAAMLADWLSARGDERHALLQEFSAHHLVPGSALAQALAARPVRVDWGVIHEDLRSLALGANESISFEFPVHVLSFRKPGP